MGGINDGGLVFMWVWLMLVSSRVDVVVALLGQLQPDAGNANISAVTHMGRVIVW